MKTAAGFLFLTMSIVAQGEELLPVETMVSKSVMLRTRDGREYYLTGNSERVNRGYAWWLGQFGHVSASERVVRSVTQRKTIEAYYQSLAIVDVRRRF